MTDETKRVSLAVITADRSAMLDACLQSLLDGDYPVHEVIVLDNASTDETPQLVAAKYPQARYIRNARNMGLSHCHNQAMRMCTGDCVFLVDDDNEAEPDMLRRIVTHMYAPGNERVAITAPVIYDFYQKSSVVLAGGRTDLWSGRNQLNSKQTPFTSEHFESLRAPNSTLIRREVIDQVGYMDEQLFSTSADEDYIRRMNVRGWICHFVLGAAIYHKAKPSSTAARLVGMTNPARAYILARNRAVLIRRYGSWLQVLCYALVWQHVYNAFYLYVVLIKSPDWRLAKAYLKGWRDAMWYMLTKRLPPLNYVLGLIDG
jgi:GT2 family glycosyltransferase